MQQQPTCWMPARDLEGLSQLVISGEPIERARNAAENYFWSCFTSISYCQDRKLIHFGMVADFENDICGRSEKHKSLYFKAPDWMLTIANALYKQRKVTRRLTQGTLLYYRPGVGVMPHYDSETAFGPEIAMISLCGTVSMEFHEDVSVNPRACRLFLKTGSMLIVQDAARYRWKHCIPQQYQDYDEQTKTWIPRYGARISFILRSQFRGGSDTYALTDWCICRMCHNQFLGNYAPRVGFCDPCKDDVKPKRYLRNPVPGMCYDRPFLRYNYVNNRKLARKTPY